MVAITVILAAVIGTFVLGLGDQVQSTSPQTSFTFDYTEQTGSHDSLDITHDGGDELDSDTVSLTQSGATDGADSDGAELVSDTTWDSTALAGTYPVTAGGSATLDETGFNEVDNDAGATGLTALDLSGATVRVVWTSESGDSSATLGKWDGPDA